jgi:glycosyltransferase involved in cell wall biosynthesis
VPWVAHFSDPWPPDGYSEGRKYSNLRLRWHRKVASVAEMVTYPCERVARYCEERQWGLDPSQRKPASLILPHIAGQFGGVVQADGGPEGGIVFLHCGGFTEKRRPDEFLLAWAAFVERHPEKRPMLKFKHVGAVSERLSALAREKEISDTVEQSGPCSYGESLYHMASAAALVLIDSYKIKTSVYFPSKLSDYVGADKPVLSFTPKDGTVADLLGEGYPLRADPWDEQGMVAVLNRALAAIEGRERAWEEPIAALREACAPAMVARRLIEGIESLQDSPQAMRL